MTLIHAHYEDHYTITVTKYRAKCPCGKQHTVEIANEDDVNVISKKCECGKILQIKI